jgi:phosphoribosylaminoimidazole-succinocarboxamide synthase
MIMLNTNQTLEQCHSAEETGLAGLNLYRSGLHKDIYDFGDTLLMVAKDQALDPDTFKLETVPNKGTIATRQSSYWFKQLSEYCPHHFISDDVDDFPAPCSIYARFLRGRSMLVKKMRPVPVKFMVIGYLQGAAWQEYRETGKIAGNLLPSGMEKAQRLPAPICLPMLDVSAGREDQNLFPEENSEFLNKTLSELATKLYFRAWKLVRNREVLLVSTIFRFGLCEDRIHLIGECITPDSSRFASPATNKRGSFPYSGEDILFHNGSCYHEKTTPQSSRADRFQNLCFRLTENG